MTAKQVQALRVAVGVSYSGIELISSEVKPGDYEVRLKLHCHGADFYSAPIEVDFSTEEMALKSTDRIDKAVGDLRTESHPTEVAS